MIIVVDSADAARSASANDRKDRHGRQDPDRA
jgi:hypothetical protein